MRNDLSKGSFVCWIWQSAGKYGVRAGEVAAYIPRGVSAFNKCKDGLKKKFHSDFAPVDRALIVATDEHGVECYYCLKAEKVTRIKDPARFVGWLDRYSDDFAG